MSGGRFHPLPEDAVRHSVIKLQPHVRGKCQNVTVNSQVVVLLVIHPEDGGSMALRNLGFLPQSRRPRYESSSPCKFQILHNCKYYSEHEVKKSAEKIQSA